jgi:hypothetical protein
VNRVGVSYVIYHARVGNRVTISPVALAFPDPERRHTVLVQIVLVAIVAVVFLVRLTLALYDRPSRPRNR